MVRIKKDWLLHKNVVGDTYSCGAPVEDRGDITDQQALSLPLCSQCFREGKMGGHIHASAKKGGREDGEANLSRKQGSASTTRRMEGWL